MKSKKTTLPKISIIVPIYNCELYLNDCIQSIVNQTYKNIEILLINDGSQDNSDKICNEWLKKDKRIIYFSKTNSGVSDTRNIGIKNATGQFIAFIDSDDIISPYYCEILYKGIANGFDLSVAGVLITANRKNLDFNLVNEYQEIKPEQAYNYLIENKQFYTYPWNKLYKLDIIKKIGQNPFDQHIHLCEDMLFNAKYLQFCKKINFNESKIYLYYQNNTSITHNFTFSYKKYSVLDAMKQLIDIYNNFSTENIIYLYKFYLFNIYILEVCLKTAKISKKLKNNNTKYMLNKIIRSYKISLKAKLITLLRYHFPVFAYNIGKIFRGNHEKNI